MSWSRAVASYRLYAARCIEVSRHILDTDSRAAMLSMAQAWIALADQADKNSETALVYETPEPRPNTDQHQEQGQNSSSAASTGDITSTQPGP
jgi:hypothetical protein